jgi:Metallopeptidase toxin 3
LQKGDFTNMRMYQDHIKAFPKFAKLISEQLPLLVHNSNILDNIQKAAGKVTGDLVRDALLWRRLPWVVPEDMENADGLYTAHTNTLRINYLRIMEYQAGEGIIQVPNGESAIYICVVILHELTHWTDWQFDKKQKKGEVGFDFEKLVYGGNVYAVTDKNKLRTRFGEWNPKEFHPIE